MNIYSLIKVVHLVLGEPTISSDHVLEPPGHAVDEVPQVVPVVHVGALELDDLPLQSLDIGGPGVSTSLSFIQ